uniref:Uncharacterized protein n=1 Tax=Arundo donax TaxID=35708 RepID=A0A0A8XWI4_ARUDO
MIGSCELRLLPHAYRAAAVFLQFFTRLSTGSCSCI